LLALVREQHLELLVEQPLLEPQRLELLPPGPQLLEPLPLRLLKPPLVSQVHSQPLQEQWVECLMEI
jgi:hypothetical protein